MNLLYTWSWSRDPYYLLLLLSFIVSLTVLKKDNYVRLFCILLGVSIISEASAYYMYWELKLGDGYNMAYHIYVLFEYTLTVLIFKNFISNKRLATHLAYSIPVFWVFSLLISYHTTFMVHPAHNFNLEGIIVILMSIYLLFTIDSSKSKSKSIFWMPIFWYCLGWIFYHTGTFCYNLLYQHFLDLGKNELAEFLHRLIIRPANYVLYFSFIIGFLCIKQIKK